MLPQPINPRTTAYVIGDGGGGTAVGDTPPVSPLDGQLWWDTVAGNLYAWYNDGDSRQWVPAFAYAVGGGAPIEGGGTFVGENPPALPTEGTLWWDSVAGNLYVWFDDGDSQQWVPAFAYAVGGGGEAATVVSDTPPSSPVEGQLWWDTVAGDLFLWYDDGDSQQWISAFASAKAGAFPVSSIPPSNPVQGQPWFDSASGGLFVYYNDGDSAQWVGLTAIG